MNYTQMISLLPDKDSPVEIAGRAFFSSATAPEDRKLFLEWMLDEERYEQLCKLMYCGNINGHFDVNNMSADYLAVTGENTNMGTRYFSLFIKSAYDCGVAEDKLIPLFYSASVSDKRSMLRGWKKASDRYLTELAKADYEKAWEFIRNYDKDFRLISILLKVDRERALIDLAHLAVFGKGVNKVALRNFLRGYRSEVFAFVRAEYSAMKTAERIAAIRLLLMFKNDVEVERFFAEVSEKERAGSVRKLLETAVRERADISDDLTYKQAIRFFYDAMVHGDSFSARKFVQMLTVSAVAQVADSLFFSVYRCGAFDGVIIVDGGKVLDLNNDPVELPDDCEVKVLHPTELTPKTEYLSRLNIIQPFEQIKRKVYSFAAMDVCSNCYSSIAGTIVKFGDFKANMRKLGFRIMNRDRDGICRQVGIVRGGVICVLDVAPLDFAAAEPDDPVLAYSVHFYAEKEAVKLGGQLYVEGAYPLELRKLDERAYSEFIYAVCELMGCR